MRNVYKQKREQGFTIIEVLIVLAIAAVILLIVFLAVPALQRNSRNSQRSNDAANVLAAVSNFQANNNGVQPNNTSTWDATNNRLTLRNTTGCGGAACSTVEVTLGYYRSGFGGAQGQVTIVSPYTATGPFNAVANDRLAVVAGADCDNNGQQTAAGSLRQISSVYALETGVNVYVGKCQAS